MLVSCESGTILARVYPSRHCCMVANGKRGLGRTNNGHKATHDGLAPLAGAVSTSGPCVCNVTAHDSYVRASDRSHLIFNCMFIGRLLSQSKLRLRWTKLFPSSNKYELLWSYQTQCMCSYGIFSLAKKCVLNVIWCLSYRWSRKDKLWRPVTHKVLNGIEIWLHTRVAMSPIFLFITLTFILDKISKLAILVLCATQQCQIVSLWCLQNVVHYRIC